MVESNDETGAAPRWRWLAALGLYLAGIVGFASGVELSQRQVHDEGLLTMAYYSLGLFVVGGLDLGTPVGGPLAGRALLWLAYFGAPIFTASAVIDATARLLLRRERWHLSRLRDHVVVTGTGDLTISYLRVLRRHSPEVPVIVVDVSAPAARVQEIEQSFGVSVVPGEITHEYLLGNLSLQRARNLQIAADQLWQLLADQTPHLGRRGPVRVEAAQLRAERLESQHDAVELGLGERG